MVVSRQLRPTRTLLGVKLPFAMPNRYYCDICALWVAADPQSRASHENGQRHKASLDMKLNQMRDIHRKKTVPPQEPSVSASAGARDEVAVPPTLPLPASDALADRDPVTGLGKWTVATKPNSKRTVADLDLPPAPVSVAMPISITEAPVQLNVKKRRILSSFSPGRDGSSSKK